MESGRPGSLTSGGESPGRGVLCSRGGVPLGRVCVEAAVESTGATGAGKVMRRRAAMSVRARRAGMSDEGSSDWRRRGV